MKKDGKYRYTLQFGSETDEEYRAGELLESLGNKKSAVIIAALNEYLASHPELQSPYCKIEVKVGSNFAPVIGYCHPENRAGPGGTRTGCCNNAGQPRFVWVKYR